MAESLFGVFDEDNSGTLNFYEYMHVQQAMGLTTPEEKLNWIFCAFDQDGDGYIDVVEIKNVVAGIIKMGGMELNKDKMIDCVSNIRDALDKDRDWNISKEEFVNNGIQSEFICSMLSASGLVRYDIHGMRHFVLQAPR